jgi:acyl-CoA thioesterase-1
MLQSGWRFRLAALVALCALAAACGGGGCLYGVERPAPEARGAANGAAPAASDPSDPPARPKIVTLGDSLTAGYGLAATQSYPSVLQERLDAEGYEFEVVNAGVSGDTSAGGLRRLEWALDGDVRVLVVALGGNDGLRGLPVDGLKQNLTAIIAEARKRKVAVILAGMEAPPNYGQEYATAFREAFREVAEREGVLFIPFLLDRVAGESALNQGDGIHPNPQGTRMVADTVWSVLRPLLDQMTAGS